ncbi:hypothetical protein TNCV_4863351 [Trichonephila clavipes]|nr:hypothetical protein TNCV_4863351 [Trichonephila clavipes]
MGRLIYQIIGGLCANKRKILLVNKNQDPDNQTRALSDWETPSIAPGERGTEFELRVGRWNNNSNVTSCSRRVSAWGKCLVR